MLRKEETRHGSIHRRLPVRTSELWRRDAHTGSAFVTVSTAASTMELFFRLPRCSLSRR